MTDQADGIVLKILKDFDQIFLDFFFFFFFLFFLGGGGRGRGGGNHRGVDYNDQYETERNPR